MAKFEFTLPKEIMKDAESLMKNSEKIFGAMTRAGAEVAAEQIRQTVPVQELADKVKLTKTYRTPSDGGISTKVVISGYIPFKGNRTTFTRRARGKTYATDKGIPAAFLANIFEYGRSGAPFPKKPFVRKAFGKKKQIEKAMLKAQKEASGGILDDK